MISDISISLDDALNGRGVSAYDVLNGQGNHIKNTSGNVYYRGLVSANKVSFEYHSVIRVAVIRVAVSCWCFCVKRKISKAASQFSSHDTLISSGISTLTFHFCLFSSSYAPAPL